MLGRRTHRRGAFWYLATTLAIPLLWSLGSTAQAAAVQIWLAPPGPSISASPSDQPGSSYFGLFDRLKQWSATSTRLNVFKIYPSVLHSASDAQLTKMFSVLRSKKIAVALEYAAVSDSTRCGRGVEGFGGEMLGNVASRIAGLGGTLDYLAMDEPLWYSVEFNGQNACHYGLGEAASIVATNIAAIKKVFPSIQIGDVEPVGQPEPKDWVALLGKWLVAFEAATGRPLSFLQVDVIWTKAWQEPMSNVFMLLKERRIPMGIIYNGNSDDTSSAAWVAHAVDHFRAFETGGRRPNQAIFQSWDKYPTHIVPETKPGTLTSLLLNYTRRPNHSSR